ncbi:hypothetical protein AGMMS50289_21380 [Betaproteobacteria bacterium]|nr:hypothetical protein AGMMS50289_21380 [Betaproteobacteria bacterium]
MHLRLEADGAGVGEIVRHARLLQKDVLRAGHGSVNQAIHVVSRLAMCVINADSPGFAESGLAF